MALCIPIEQNQVDHYLLACNQTLRSGIRRGNMNTREEKSGGKGRTVPPTEESVPAVISVRGT